MWIRLRQDGANTQRCCCQPACFIWWCEHIRSPSELQFNFNKGLRRTHPGIQGGKQSEVAVESGASVTGCCYFFFFLQLRLSCPLAEQLEQRRVSFSFFRI